MSQPTVVPGSGWSVVGSRSVTAPNQAGILATQWEVTFVTGNGEQGMVLVPTTSYTPDNVRAAIAAAALTMDQVKGLKG